MSFLIATRSNSKGCIYPVLLHSEHMGSALILFEDQSIADYFICHQNDKNRIQTIPLSQFSKACPQYMTVTHDAILIADRKTVDYFWGTEAAKIVLTAPNYFENLIEWPPQQ